MDLWGKLLLVNFALVALASLVVVSRRKEPAVTLAWIVGFVFLPFIGTLAYLFFGYRRFRNRKRRKPNPGKRVTQTAGLPIVPSALLVDELKNVERLAHRLTAFPTVAQNSLQIYEEAFSTYGAIADAIRQAKHHVHLEYYSFQPDETGRYFRDLLIEKAKQGIQCRLLVDALGSRPLNSEFLDPLRAHGVKVAFFWPLTFLRQSWAFHLRNHRKIAVIDGRTGFIGSQNIGNEYLQWMKRRLSWRDTTLKVEGPVVEQIQTIFCEDWDFTVGENLSGPLFFPPAEAKGTSLIQTLPTGPDESENSLQLILISAIHAAQTRITITTPYFVPSMPMILALVGAARRGVSVELLVPSKSDHPLLIWVARSWYRELAESGVKIYEYGETFVHAKVVTIDTLMALVGSANMDIRSFALNFESSLLLYDTPATAHLCATFDKTIAKAKLVEKTRVRVRNFPRALLEGVCRALSPVL